MQLCSKYNCLNWSRELISMTLYHLCISKYQVILLWNVSSVYADWCLTHCIGMSFSHAVCVICSYINERAVCSTDLSACKFSAN